MIFSNQRMASSSLTERPPVPRVFSESDCRAFIARVQSMLHDGGSAKAGVSSTWAGGLRFARNRFTTGGDVRNTYIMLTRALRGALAAVTFNAPDDSALEAAIRRSEHLLRFNTEDIEGDDLAQEHYRAVAEPAPAPNAVRIDTESRAAALAALINKPEPMPRPTLFMQRTFDMSADERANALAPLVEPIQKAGMMAAGYMQVAGEGRGVMSTEDQFLYYPATMAQYSVTVRTPDGTGSGWAGVDWNDWSRIDGPALTAVALDKCLRSRNPVVLEPGRYTAVLEPQAVADLCAPLFTDSTLSFPGAEMGFGPYSNGAGKMTKIGERMFDPRITVTMDPEDPDCGFVPFDLYGNVYHKTTWVENGILKNLSYSRRAGRDGFGKDVGQPSSNAFRMAGGTTTMEEMIATTKRGVLVTRFWGLQQDKEDVRGSGLLIGYTRDGLWLIENGKISKAIKNFRIRESPVFVLNNVEMVGAAKRVFSPEAPIIVPFLKVRDFNFVALSNAV